MPRHTKALRNLTQLVIDGKAAFPDGERCWYTAKDARLSINKKVLFNDENDILYFVTNAGCHWVLSHALLIRSEQFGAVQWIEGVDVKFLRRDFTHPFTNGDGRKMAAGCRICRLPWENFASLENKRDMVVPMVVYINTKANPPYHLLGRIACLEGSGSDLKEVLLKIQSDPSVCILVCKEFALQYDCNSKSLPGQLPISRGTADEPNLGGAASGSKEARPPTRAEGKLSSSTKSPRATPAPRMLGKSASSSKEQLSKAVDKDLASSSRHGGLEEESIFSSLNPERLSIPAAAALPPGMGPTIALTAPDALRNVPVDTSGLDLAGLQLVPTLVRQNGEARLVLCLHNPALHGPALGGVPGSLQGSLPGVIPAGCVEMLDELQRHQQLSQSPFPAASLQQPQTHPYSAPELYPAPEPDKHRLAPSKSSFMRFKPEAVEPSSDAAEDQSLADAALTLAGMGEDPKAKPELDHDKPPAKRLALGSRLAVNLPSVEVDEQQWRSHVKSPFAGASLSNLAQTLDAKDEQDVLYAATDMPSQAGRVSPAGGAESMDGQGQARVKYFFSGSNPAISADSDDEDELKKADSGLRGPDAPDPDATTPEVHGEPASFLQIQPMAKFSQISRIRGNNVRADLQLRGELGSAGHAKRQRVSPTWQEQDRDEGPISIAAPKPDENDVCSEQPNMFQLSFINPKALERGD